MGKFVNQEIINTVDNTVEGFKDRLKNPYYSFNQEKPITVTYFNINKEHTSFDEATGLNEASYGPNSSIKYNKIVNFVMYGLDKMPVNITTQDVGTEADELGGRAVIVPNTITPYAGDYLMINHIKEILLFKVIDAQSDTLDNGANVWSIEYKVETGRLSDIEMNVIDEYVYMINNVGSTSFNPLLKRAEYDLVDSLDSILTKLRSYYTDIFYSDRVDSLIFIDSGRRVYDSYLTEFVIKNKIIQEDSNNYIYLDHQLKVPKTFAIDYNRSLFKKIEDRDKKGFVRSLHTAYSLIIESKINIFSTRYEDYWYLIYDDLKGMTTNTLKYYAFRIISEELIEDILSINLTKDNMFDNIIIKYLNDIDITTEDFKNIDEIDYMQNIDLFYKIPIVLYIIEFTIKNTMLGITKVTN